MTKPDAEWDAIYAALRDVAPRVLVAFPSAIATDAEEIIQSIVVKLHQLDQFGDLPEHISHGYLGRLVKWRALDRLRSKRFQERSLDRIRDLAMAIDQDRDLTPLRSALDQLDQHDRDLIMRFYIDGVPIGKLAADNKVSYSAMAQQLHRIKNRLRRTLRRCDLD